MQKCEVDDAISTYRGVLSSTDVNYDLSAITIEGFVKFEIFGFLVIIIVLSNCRFMLVRITQPRKSKTYQFRIYILSVQGIDLIYAQIFNTSIITEEVEAIDDTVEAEVIVDAREVHEDNLEATNEGTKGEEHDDRDEPSINIINISV